MGTHTVFEGSAAASFAVNEDGETIEAKTGNVSLELNGVSAVFAAKAGIVAMLIDGLGSNICMQSEDGSTRVCVNLTTQVITLQLGNLRILINSPYGGVSILVGDIGIMILGGAVSIAVDGACLSISKLIEVLLKLAGWCDYVPGLPSSLKFDDTAFLCDSWTPPP